MRKAGIALATIVLAGAFVVPVFGTESLVRKAEWPTGASRPSCRRLALMFPG